LRSFSGLNSGKHTKYTLTAHRFPPPTQRCVFLTHMSRTPCLSIFIKKQEQQIRDIFVRTLFPITVGFRSCLLRTDSCPLVPPREGAPFDECRHRRGRLCNRFGRPALAQLSLSPCSLVVLQPRFLFPKSAVPGLRGTPRPRRCRAAPVPTVVVFGVPRAAPDGGLSRKRSTRLQSCVRPRHEGALVDESVPPLPALVHRKDQFTHIAP